MPPATFGTSLALFKTDSVGHVLSCSARMPLDPSDPLTQIKVIEMPFPLKWPATGYPMFTIQYQSFKVSTSSFAMIEWRGTFDPNSGKFIARRPTGMDTKLRDGREVGRMFQVRRVSPTEIVITDVLSNTSKPYGCTSPCVVDRRTMWAEWGNP